MLSPGATTGAPKDAPAPGEAALHSGIDARAAEALSLGSGAGQAGPYTFLDHCPLELGENAHHPEQGPAGRRGRLHVLLVKVEVDAQGVQLGQETHQVLADCARAGGRSRP